MNALRRLFDRNPGRDLGELSAASRKRKALASHERMLAVTRQIRVETGLPPTRALEAR